MKTKNDILSKLRSHILLIDQLDDERDYINTMYSMHMSSLCIEASHTIKEKLGISDFVTIDFTVTMNDFKIFLAFNSENYIQVFYSQNKIDNIVVRFENYYLDEYVISLYRYLLDNREEMEYLIENNRQGKELTRLMYKNRTDILDALYHNIPNLDTLLNADNEFIDRDIKLYATDCNVEFEGVQEKIHFLYTK